MSAVAESPKHLACADAIDVRVEAKQTEHLRSLLRESSLGSLMSESCRDYVATLTHKPSGGWSVTMTSEQSQSRFEREVATLEHAATWIEAWTQSGFPADANEPKPATVAPAESASPRLPPPIQPMRAFVGAGPLAAVTSQGQALAGGRLYGGVPRGHNPWFGAEFGLATELNMPQDDYRRCYWAGPVLGLSWALGQNLYLRPALAAGVFGIAARHLTASAHSSSLYAGISTDVEFEVSEHLALGLGLEGRWLFENLLGSSTTPAQPAINEEVEDDEEDDAIPSPEAPTASASLGQVWVALRLGITWTFGDPQ